MITKIWNGFMLLCLAFFCAVCIMLVGLVVVQGIMTVYQSTYAETAKHVVGGILLLMFVLGMARAIVWFDTDR